MKKQQHENRLIYRYLTNYNKNASIYYMIYLFSSESTVPNELGIV